MVGEFGSNQGGSGLVFGSIVVDNVWVSPKLGLIGVIAS
jgi:hypothetical protein